MGLRLLPALLAVPGSLLLFAGLSLSDSLEELRCHLRTFDGKHLIRILPDLALRMYGEKWVDQGSFY